jgi:hypothetical protein
MQGCSNKAPFSGAPVAVGIMNAESQKLLQRVPTLLKYGQALAYPHMLLLVVVHAVAAGPGSLRANIRAVLERLFLKGEEVPIIGMFRWVGLV